jgi:hypothetical protein
LGYILPSSQFVIEPMLHLPSDPNAQPFNISLDPYPLIPPLVVTHSCPYTTNGTDITIVSYLPPCPSFDLDSPDVLRILSANADSHLQVVFQKRKLCHGNKHDPDIGARINGIIGDLLLCNTTILPFAIDPFGCIGLLARMFLFGTMPAELSFPASRPNASEMHCHITSFPSLTGILPHADHTWSTTHPPSFYGTPSQHPHLICQHF